MRRILQYGVCASNAARCDTRSKKMAASQVAFNVAKNKPEGCFGHTECLPKPLLYLSLLLESCNNFISRGLRCNFENGTDKVAVVFVSSPLIKCCVASS